MPTVTDLAAKKRKSFPIRIIAEAVSYRMPLAVTKIREFTISGCYPVCPRCDNSLDREYQAYCDRCGQKLGWFLYDRVCTYIPGREKESP